MAWENTCLRTLAAVAWRAGRIGGVVALAAAAGCTSLLGIGGDFTVDATGGASASSGASGLGGQATGGAATTGGGGTGGAAGAGGGGGGVVFPEHGPITGHVVTWLIGPQHAINAQIPVDLSQGHVVEALSPAGNGTWTTYAADMPLQTDGHFTIRHVPDGPYLLHVDDFYAWMRNRDGIDLDDYVTMRTGVQPLVHDPEVDFDLSNMTPWVDGDSLEVISTTTYAYGLIQDYPPLSPPIQAGDTTVTGAGDWWDVMAFGGGQDNLITPSDPVQVFHVGKYGPNPYTTILDFASLTVDMPDTVDGAPFAITATFSPVPQNQTFHLHTNGPKYDAAIAAFGIPATGVFLGANYDVLPESVDVAGQTSAAPDLVLYSGAVGQTAIDETFAFGNPFPKPPAPDAWDPVVYVFALGNIEFQLPGLAPTGPILTALFGDVRPPDDPAFQQAGGLVPGVGVPLHAKVDGHPFAASGTPMLSTLTPTLTWDPPATGEPASWSIIATRLYPSADGTKTKLGASPTFHVGGWTTSFTIPPGILVPSSVYHFRIVAGACASCDFEAAPARVLVPNAFATLFSNSFTTPAM